MRTSDGIRLTEKVGIGLHISDGVLLRPIWAVHKFHDPDGHYYRAARAGKPMTELMQVFSDRFLGVAVAKGNLGLNEGLNALWTLLAGTGETAFDNAHAYIGVGDSATAAAATQTGLQAATNKLYKAMDASYPTYGTLQKATWRSTYADADANWAWNEMTVANGNSDASKNLNRKVQAMGTKVNTVSWTASLEISAS